MSKDGTRRLNGSGLRRRLPVRGNATGAELAEALGPLESRDDAKRWMELVGRRSAAGEINPSAAAKAIARVREWRIEQDQDAT